MRIIHQMIDLVKCYNITFVSFNTFVGNNDLQLRDIGEKVFI